MDMSDDDEDMIDTRHTKHGRGVRSFELGCKDVCKASFVI
jgi:hypothetical protein